MVIKGDEAAFNGHTGGKGPFARNESRIGNVALTKAVNASCSAVKQSRLLGCSQRCSGPDHVVIALLHNHALVEPVRSLANQQVAGGDAVPGAKAHGGHRNHGINLTSDRVLINGIRHHGKLTGVSVSVRDAGILNIKDS